MAISHPRPSTIELSSLTELKKQASATYLHREEAAALCSMMSAELTVESFLPAVRAYYRERGAVLDDDQLRELFPFLDEDAETSVRSAPVISSSGDDCFLYAASQPHERHPVVAPRVLAQWLKPKMQSVREALDECVEHLQTQFQINVQRSFIRGLLQGFLFSKEAEACSSALKGADEGDYKADVVDEIMGEVGEKFRDYTEFVADFVHFFKNLSPETLEEWKTNHTLAFDIPSVPDSLKASLQDGGHREELLSLLKTNGCMERLGPEWELFTLVFDEVGVRATIYPLNVDYATPSPSARLVAGGEETAGVVQLGPSTLGYTSSAFRGTNEDGLFFDPAAGQLFIADGVGGVEGGERTSALALKMMGAFDNRIPPRVASQRIAGELAALREKGATTLGGIRVLAKERDGTETVEVFTLGDLTALIVDPQTRKVLYASKPQNGVQDQVNSTNHHVRLKMIDIFNRFIRDRIEGNVDSEKDYPLIAAAIVQFFSDNRPASLSASNSHYLPRVDTQLVRCPPGSIKALVTDGITDVIHPSEIADIFFEHDFPTAVSRIIGRADSRVRILLQSRGNTESSLKTLLGNNSKGEPIWMSLGRSSNLGILSSNPRERASAEAYVRMYYTEDNQSVLAEKVTGI